VLPDDHPLRMQFCELLRHQYIVDQLLLCNILWTDEGCFLCFRVRFNINNSHVWARDNPYAIRERGHQVRFRVSVWAGTVGDIFVGPHLIPNKLPS
jgi:hypothetical protein